MPIERQSVETHAPVTTTEVVTTAPPAAAVDRGTATAYDPYATRRQTGYRLVQAIYLIFGIIEALLVIRLVLRASGANPAAGFAQFVYGVTAPFLAPFVGLFGSPQAGGSVLEIHTIVALVVYALVAWLLGRLAWLLVGETRSAVATTASSVETRV
jgi:YggT family protein